MQTSTVENLDALSPECRQALKNQIKRVQMEAKHLRSQMDELRRAQDAKKDERKYLQDAERAEKKERKHLRDAAHAQKQERKHRQGAGYSEKSERKPVSEQLAATGKEWQENALKRSKEWQENALKRSKEWQENALKQGKQLKQLTTAGSTLTKAGAQLSTGLKHGKNLRDQLSSQVDTGLKHGKNLRDQLSSQVGTGLERGKDLRDQLSGQTKRNGPMLYKQTGRHFADWKDDLTYIMLRQGQHFLHLLMDRRDDATHLLHKQSKKLGRNLADRTDDVAWQLHKQRHQLERNLAYQKEDAARKLRKQSQKLNRHVSEHRTLWSILGFITGLLVAGGIAYWFTKRMVHRYEEEEEMELQQSYPSNGDRMNAGNEKRYPQKGRAAVATRYRTRAEPTSMFVGVLNTKRYYPIERRPDVDAQDLVFFEREEDARAEGFSEAR